MDEPTALPPQVFNVLELADYTVDFQVIQNLNLNWAFNLQFFPTDSNSKLTDEDEHIPGLGYIRKIEANAALLYSREYYTNWEYAAEIALDVIEGLGFKVDADIHFFDVIFWDNDNQERIIKKAMSDGLDFKLVKPEL